MDNLPSSEWFPRQSQPADDSGPSERAADPLAEFVAQLVRRGQLTFGTLAAGFVHLRILPGSRIEPERPGEGREDPR
jgi:hypothetical protein